MLTGDPVNSCKVSPNADCLHWDKCPTFFIKWRRVWHSQQKWQRWGWNVNNYCISSNVNACSYIQAAAKTPNETYHWDRHARQSKKRGFEAAEDRARFQGGPRSTKDGHLEVGAADQTLGGTNAWPEETIWIGGQTTERTVIIHFEIA